MKKLAAVLLVFCLAASGVPAGLAAVAHVHGADSDHSDHTGCALHHFQTHGASFDVCSVSPAVPQNGAAVFLRASSNVRFLPLAPLSARVPRAPPAAPSF